MHYFIADEFDFDVIVVGAGHAGCEAAAAAANLGCKVLLITMNMHTIAQMSCNPAMGGIAKGQIVREIDALGGYSGIVTDRTRVQFRMLNRTKGPAMWSPRAQSDRLRFAEMWRWMLENTPNVFFRQDMVTGLLIQNDAVYGVITAGGAKLRSKAVILTNGTFLNGIIHVGERQQAGGRAAERAATGITEQLVTLGFQTGRMKTGTPPRLDGRTIDYKALEIQEGDPEISNFSYLPPDPDAESNSAVHYPSFITKNEGIHRKVHGQLCCYIAYTSPEVHQILSEGFDRSPMFCGRIQGIGPRYCPSIEDKIVRFADKTRHQLFVEPEGWHTFEVYLNGFSSSLPEEIQYKALRKIPGFANVRMFRPGYAIEYDYFPPHQLQLSLETQAIANLYFAGQINGTTGYEEAAAQGIMAGINAALKIRGDAPLILGRNEAYIGVLIDDLINKGTEEPYRMFTSRAEYRILLRQDNADLRLTEKSYQLGLASQARYMRVVSKREQTAQLLGLLQQTLVEPAAVNGWLESRGQSVIRQKIPLARLLNRPEINLADLTFLHPSMAAQIANYDTEVQEQVQIQLKYAGYIEKEIELADKMKRLESVPLPASMDYKKITALSNEAREKLTRIRPRSLGQASRISGVSPADISVLMVFIGR
jgi:tRNA uridine 5-carboxymethylaminomethyl modification enzyme